MSTVVVESILTGRKEEIEVALGKYSTLTFSVIEKIGIIPEVDRINGQIEYLCKALIYPQRNNRPPIATHIRLVTSIDGIDGILRYPVFVEVADPFSVPWKTYLQLPQQGAERLKERAWEENRDWIKEQIEERNADWILVCNRDVIEWSDNRKEYPSREKLKEIIEEYGLFPFVFARPPLIEETNWNKTIYKNDYYPTIKISVCGNLGLTGDMDTGSPNTALDRDQLISSGNLKPELIDTLQKGIFHGELYEYSIDKVHIQITDELGKKESKSITCDCVKDWRESLLYCK